MSLHPKPTDAEIKGQIITWGSQQMTYAIRNRLSMAGRGGATRQECLWLNPACMAALHQTGLQLGETA